MIFAVLVFAVVAPPSIVSIKPFRHSFARVFQRDHFAKQGAGAKFVIARKITKDLQDVEDCTDSNEDPQISSGPIG